MGMQNISANIISALIKKGVLGEMKNFKTTVDIPGSDEKPIKIIITADNLQIKFDKEN